MVSPIHGTKRSPRTRSRGVGGRAPSAGLVLLLGLAALPGCEGDRGPGTGGPERPGMRKDLYIMVSMLGGLEYFYDHKMGLERAGRDLGVETRYAGPAGLDKRQMAQAFESAILQEPGGIIVVGFEDFLVPLIEKAAAKGIPVVTVDSDLPQSRRIAFVGTGNYEAGRRGGAKLAELLGGEGQVLILTKVGQWNLEERVRGYRDALAGHPGIEIVKVSDTESDKRRAAQATATALRQYAELAGIACVEAAGGSGAATAVREAGRGGEVKIVAMDRGNDVLSAIQQGVISATVVQQTALMPYYAMHILYDLNHHALPISKDNAKAGVPGAPPVIDTGVIIVDRSNCAYFMR